MLTNVKHGKNMRSVSIVGVGATPFFNGVENPTYKGLTNGELFGYAALDAMADAGIEPRDVQYFFHGSANPHVLYNCITPNLQVADWFGMRGKGSISHSETMKSEAVKCTVNPLMGQQLSAKYGTKKPEKLKKGTDCRRRPCGNGSSHYPCRTGT